MAVGPEEAQSAEARWGAAQEDRTRAGNASFTLTETDSETDSQGGHGTGKTGKTGNLVLTFSRQGKHREFCFGTGKILKHRENVFL